MRLGGPSPAGTVPPGTYVPGFSTSQYDPISVVEPEKTQHGLEISYGQGEAGGL